MRHWFDGVEIGIAFEEDANGGEIAFAEQISQTTEPPAQDSHVGCGENPTSGRPIHETQTPPTAMSAMPTAIRASKFSLKTNHASNAGKDAFKIQEQRGAGRQSRRQPEGVGV